MRMVEQIHSVLCFGSKTWSWSGAILERMGDTDYEALAQKKEDETLTRYCTKSEKTIAGGMWRAMGWTHDTRKKRYSFLHGARHGGKFSFAKNTTKDDFQQSPEVEAQSRLYI